MAGWARGSCCRTSDRSDSASARPMRSRSSSPAPSNWSRTGLHPLRGCAAGHGHDLPGRRRDGDGDSARLGTPAEQQRGNHQERGQQYGGAASADCAHPQLLFRLIGGRSTPRPRHPGCRLAGTPTSMLRRPPVKKTYGRLLVAPEQRRMRRKRREPDHVVARTRIQPVPVGSVAEHNADEHGLGLESHRERFQHAATDRPGQRKEFVGRRAAPVGQRQAVLSRHGHPTARQGVALAETGAFDQPRG